MILVGSGSSHFLIRIRIWIQGNDTDSTDPDPQHWSQHVSGNNFKPHGYIMCLVIRTNHMVLPRVRQEGQTTWSHHLSGKKDKPHGRTTCQARRTNHMVTPRVRQEGQTTRRSNHRVTPRDQRFRSNHTIWKKSTKMENSLNCCWWGWVKVTYSVI